MTVSFQGRLREKRYKTVSLMLLLQSVNELPFSEMQKIRREGKRWGGGEGEGASTSFLK